MISYHYYIVDKSFPRNNNPCILSAVTSNNLIIVSHDGQDVFFPSVRHVLKLYFHLTTQSTSSIESMIDFSSNLVLRSINADIYCRLIGAALGPAWRLLCECGVLYQICLQNPATWPPGTWLTLHTMHPHLCWTNFFCKLQILQCHHENLNIS